MLNYQPAIGLHPQLPSFLGHPGARPKVSADRPVSRPASWPSVGNVLPWVVEAWWNASAKSEVAYTNECLTFAHVLSFKLLLLVGLCRRTSENTSGSQIGGWATQISCLLLFALHHIGTVISTVHRKSLRLSFTLPSRIDRRLSLLSDCRHSEV
jgi:hypothetical protein